MAQIPDYFTQPRVQPYDPPPWPVGELTVNVEWQRQDRDDWTLGAVKTERTGRVRIVIEGEGEHVRPYLEAVQRIASNQDSVQEGK